MLMGLRECELFIWQSLFFLSFSNSARKSNIQLGLGLFRASITQQKNKLYEIWKDFELTWLFALKQMIIIPVRLYDEKQYGRNIGQILQIGGD